MDAAASFWLPAVPDTRRDNPLTGSILISIAHSMIALILVGALLVPLFSRPYLEESVTTKLLLGLIFVVTIAALSISSIVMEFGGVLNASAGVLIFSAYLGGPIAGLMTLLVSLSIRIAFGGDLIILAVVIQIAYTLAGLLLRWIKPFTAWPQLPNGILAWSLSAFTLMHMTSIVLVIYLELIPDISAIAYGFALFTLTAALSVTVTWLVIRQSWRLASIERENNALLRQLQLIFENGGIGVFRYNGQSDRLDFDRSFLKLYGMSEDDALHPGNFTRRLVHPDDQEDMQAYIRNATRGEGSSNSCMFRAYRNDGQLRYMRSYWQLESVTSEGLRNFIGLHMDVSDVITAQQQHTEAQQQITAIAENLPGVIFQLIWQDTLIIELSYVSPKCLDFWGLAQDALYNDPRALSGQFDASEEAKVLRALTDAVMTGNRGSTRAWMQGRDNKRIAVEIQLQAVDRGDGTHLVNGIFVDVTNEVNAQEEADLQAALARQSQKTESIGRLTGGIAHDFNNILAIILSNLELLRETVDSDKQKAMIDAGIVASHRGAGLTRSMLSFARTASLDPEVLDLNEVIRHAKNWMRRALPESVEVEMSLLAGLWPVRLDAASLESALLNLLVNARDAMDSHGSLTIETANVRIDQPFIDARNETISPGRYVLLAVSDTGSGIDEKTLESIFDPFFTTKPPGVGSGVGLSMVQGFVRQSLGTIHVYTEPGKGTSFKIYFPVTDHEPPVNHKKADPTASLQQGNARILLVEDDANIREVQLAMLERGGYQVVTASSGDAALELFNTDAAFDLVVTDIVMPGKLQGTDLARNIHESHPTIPFIFMSGYAAEATVHGNGLRPEDIRLMKPVSMADLLNAVAVLIKSRL